LEGIATTGLGAALKIRNDPQLEQFRRSFQMGEVLGTGHFGVTTSCTCVRTGRKLAAKQIDKARVPSARRLANEVAGLTLSAHRHVLPLLEVFDSTHTLVLITERANGGDLFERLGAKKRAKQRISARAACRLTLNLLSAVDAVHGAGFVHRDVNPRNLLMRSAGSDSDIWLADFGLARHLRRANQSDPPLARADVARERALSDCGTREFMAPEQLERPQSGGDRRHTGYAGYGQEADCWACGVTLYTALCGALPSFLYGTPDADGGRVLVGLAFPPHVPPAAQDVIRGLLRPEPSLRLTVRQALASEWMRRAGGCADEDNPGGGAPCRASVRGGCARGCRALARGGAAAARGAVRAVCRLCCCCCGGWGGMGGRYAHLSEGAQAHARPAARGSAAGPEIELRPIAPQTA
jgi:serine/threonine protein kinase